ncbi:hypothetical protein BJ138DRAFT_1020478, partial [Hygrophoropsis aurantiaca]
PQIWRDFLNSIPSEESLAITAARRAAEGRSPTTAAIARKMVAKELFGEDLLDVQGTTWAIKDSVEWRGQLIPISTLSDPPTRLMRQILWELYELNFRFELLALDHIMAPEIWEEAPVERRELLYSIFPGEGGLVMWSGPLPSEEEGLFCGSFKQAAPYVESFRKLLWSWNGAPARLRDPVELKGDGNQTFWTLMECAAHFYVQTFFDHFGRPLVVPHTLPT